MSLAAFSLTFLATASSIDHWLEVLQDESASSKAIWSGSIAAIDIDLLLRVELFSLMGTIEGSNPCVLEIDVFYFVHCNLVKVKRTCTVVFADILLEEPLSHTKSMK